MGEKKLRNMLKPSKVEGGSNPHLNKIQSKRHCTPKPAKLDFCCLLRVMETSKVIQGIGSLWMYETLVLVIHQDSNRHVLNLLCNHLKLYITEILKTYSENTVSNPCAVLDLSPHCENNAAAT